MVKPFLAPVKTVCDCKYHRNKKEGYTFCNYPSEYHREEPQKEEKGINIFQIFISGIAVVFFGIIGAGFLVIILNIINQLFFCK